MNNQKSVISRHSQNSLDSSETEPLLSHTADNEPSSSQIRILPEMVNGLPSVTIQNDATNNRSVARYTEGNEDVECGQQMRQNEGSLNRSELVKTLIAFLCMVVSAFLNFFLLTLIHDIVPRQPLPDLVFMAIPQQRWAWSVGDVLSTFSSVVSFVCIVLHRHRQVVLRRLLLLGAIMYGLRAIVMSVTFLPPSFHNRDQICLPQVNRSAMYAMEIATRFLTYMFTLGLTSGQDKILCGDLMFSGHTVVFSTMYFVQLHYTPRRLTFLRVVMAPVCFLGISSLVVSGGHYTMDVLIAYWLTSHVFWSYHHIFESCRGQRAKTPLTNLWWFYCVYWFETDVPDKRLPNEYNWPFRWPQLMIDKVHALSQSLQ